MRALDTIDEHIGVRTNDGRRTFAIGDIGVSIRSDLPEALDDFAALYPETPSARARSAPSIDMTIKCSRRSKLRGRRYDVCGDGNEIFTGKRRREVLPYLEWGINRRVLETRGEFLQFHAATLACAGRGFVFPGHSGFGKSTLSAGLLSRGWNYLTDELTLVDADALAVHPFPKALCIKAGSFDVVEDLGLHIRKGRNYVKALKGRVGYVVPQEEDAMLAAGCARPIRFVIFPKYVEGTQPKLYPISRSRAVFVLASCALNRHLFGERSTSIISDIVRGAQCFGLETGRLDATCDLLESLV